VTAACLAIRAARRTALVFLAAGALLALPTVARAQACIGRPAVQGFVATDRTWAFGDGGRATEDAIRVGPGGWFWLGAWRQTGQLAGFRAPATASGWDILYEARADKASALCFDLGGHESRLHEVHAPGDAKRESAVLQTEGLTSGMSAALRLPFAWWLELAPFSRVGADFERTLVGRYNRDSLTETRATRWSALWTLGVGARLTWATFGASWTGRATAGDAATRMPGTWRLWTGAAF